MNPDRWPGLMDRLGLASCAGTRDALLAAYREPHRRYHDATHLEDCLREFDRIPRPLPAAGEIELALWFHDAVYVVGAADNEVRSARWAARFLRDAGAATGTAGWVHDLVMATRHADAGEPSTDAARWVVDVDLSILGRSARTYDRFERRIREEYRVVPEATFRQRRAALLRGFLARPRIYHTPFFHDAYEIPARANLERTVQSLE